MILPEGFTLAPPDRIPEKLKEETKGLQFIQYSENTPNILVVGPVPGKLYEEMTVALLSPDPATNKNVHFGTVPVYVGANRGRGQVQIRAYLWGMFFFVPALSNRRKEQHQCLQRGTRWQGL